MALEFKVNIKSYLNLPKRTASTVYNAYIADTAAAVMAGIKSGATVADINKIVSAKNREYYDEIHYEFRKNMTKYSGKEWATLAKEDSYGITMKARLNKSINRSFNTMRNKSKTLHMQLNKITDPEQLDALVNKFVKEYSDSVTSALSHDSNRLNTTQQQYYKQQKRDAKLNGKVIWRFGPTNNHCSECSGYEGTVYENASAAPVRPVHPNCGCYLEEYNQ